MNMTLRTIVNNFISILRPVAVLIVASAVLIFLYGLLGYITNSADESKRKESIQYIIYGIFGLFLMVSIWGLVAILTNTFGISFGIPVIL